MNLYICNSLLALILHACLSLFVLRFSFNEIYFQLLSKVQPHKYNISLSSTFHLVSALSSCLRDNFIYFWNNLPDYGYKYLHPQQFLTKLYSEIAAQSDADSSLNGQKNQKTQFSEENPVLGSCIWWLTLGYHWV